MNDNSMKAGRAKAVVVEGKDFYVDIALLKHPRKGLYIRVQHYSRSREVKREVITFLKTFATIGDGMHITSLYADPPRRRSAKGAKMAMASNGIRGHLMLE